MIIGRDSWIRRFPIVLSPTQGYFLDGVRIAVQTAETSFTRLKKNLDSLALDPDSDSEPRIIKAVQDAWFVVDAVDRVRSLVKNAPNMGPDPVDAVRIFLDATEAVRELRNHLHHLDGHLERLARTGGPAWGFIGWTTWVGEGSKLQGYVCSLAGGTVKPSAQGLLRSRGWMPEALGEQVVVLEAAGVVTRLDQLMVELERLVRWLEDVLHENFRSLKDRVPNTLPDLLTVLTLNMDEFRRAIEEEDLP